jgi:hypothetical protein
MNIMLLIIIGILMLGLIWHLLDEYCIKKETKDDE